MSLLNIKGMFGRPTSPTSPTSPTGPNVELLRQALDFVTNNPGYWQQSYWAARSGRRCLAGHIVEMTGYTIAFDDNGPTVGYRVADGRILGVLGSPGDHTTEGESIPMVAARELRMPLATVYRLFDGHNDLGHLWMIANELTDGAVGWPDPKGGPRERVAHEAVEARRAVLSTSRV